MKLITSSKGNVFSVSDEDYEYLIKFKWSELEEYAYCKEGTKSLLMHRIVAERMGLNGRIDHKDRDRTNNQRENLRIATGSQNGANKTMQSNNASGYRGVAWRHDKNKWEVRISVRGNSKFLGFFTSEIDAAKQYDYHAKQYFKEFAVLNFTE